MASPDRFCSYHNRGHCKYGDRCRKEHINESCDQISCDQTNCFKRHPKRCRYFYLEGYCKFGAMCSYLHLRNDRNETCGLTFTNQDDFNIHNGYLYCCDDCNICYNIQNVVLKMK